MVRHIPRTLATAIQEASAHFKVLLLTGPRQVGKTTLLQDIEKDSRSYVTLDDLNLRTAAQQDPAPFQSDGFAYILADTYGDLLNTKGKRYINAIRENSQHMAQMLDDFLRLFRLRNEPLKIETIDMTAMAQKTFATHISRYANSCYTLHVDTLPQAKGDPELIRQIWSNLLDNAMKFTREKESLIIEIGGYTTDKYHVYSVKDNGIGFDTDYKNKLFGVFERLHPDRFEGMGVGLAIVSRIVQLHGGYVDAKGNVNQGATFYFALPLQNIGVVTEYSPNRAIDTLHLTQNNSLS